MNRLFRWAATLGLIAACGGIGLSAARAQDYDDGGLRQHIRRDQQDIRRDQARLRDLQRQRREEAHEGDWREARDLDQQIDQLRWHIQQDQRDVRRDRWQARHNRDGNNDYPRWNDNRDAPPRWNGNQRWHRAHPPRHDWDDGE